MKVNEDNAIYKDKSKLQSRLDIYFNSYLLYALKKDFIKDGKINAVGRFFMKLLAAGITALFILTEKNQNKVICVFSVLSIIMPYMIDGITVGLIKKQNINPHSLYDMLYGFGLYAILSVAILGMVIVIMSCLSKILPEIYTDFIGVPLYTAAAAAIIFIADGAAMIYERIKHEE